MNKHCTMNTEFQNIPSEENPPTAKAMINTFRAFGYDLNMAIADIIDNSISAHSTSIWVDLNWNGADSTITIHDDGFGMSLDELRNAMKPGSKDPNDQRELDDLGEVWIGPQNRIILTMQTAYSGFEKGGVYATEEVLGLGLCESSSIMVNVGFCFG